MNNFTVTNIFGSHMMMRFQMDKEALSKFQRLPGLQSSFVGLDTLMNLDEDMDFGDYLKGKNIIDPSLNFNTFLN